MSNWKGILKKVIVIGLALLLTRWLLGCAALSGLVEPTPTPTPTPVPPPPTVIGEPLTLTAPVEVTDGDIHTAYSEPFTVTAEEPIGSLYLEWDLIPGQWTLLADGKEIVCGENGFLHEYILLDTPATELVFEVPVPMGNVYAFGYNLLMPDWVQIWEPAHERADLLVIPTHADDEHIFFGGMMPYYAAERGLKVQVVYFTNHWAEKHRMHEQLDGLWTVGIRNYPFVGHFYDYHAQSLEDAEEFFTRDAAVEFLVEQLRRFKPSVVIGHDLEGEYGHGVHCLNAYALTDAVELSMNPDCYPVSVQAYGVWDVPKLYLHLYPQNEIIMDWTQPMAAFDGKNGFEVAAEGYNRHISQRDAFHIYGEGEDFDSRRFGLYRSTVGPDVVGGDVFENITNYY